MAQRFEEILVWQKARLFSNDIYESFRGCRDYGFRDQIQRAAISVMNNIAEGSERASQKELRQFLYIAKGSSGEVRSMLVIANDQGYIDKTKYVKLHGQAEELSKMLSGFIKKLRV